jgi:hypothetical protein
LYFAAGLNNLVTNGKLKILILDFLGSHFYEFSYNSRIVKNIICSMPNMDYHDV